jgi:hypothetical protein
MTCSGEDVRRGPGERGAQREGVVARCEATGSGSRLSPEQRLGDAVGP